MRKQKISSGISSIDRRAGFFHYFFEKNRTCIGEYRTVTAMVFDKRETETVLQQNSYVSETHKHTHAQTINETHQHMDVSDPAHAHKSDTEVIPSHASEMIRNQETVHVHLHKGVTEKAQRDFHETVLNRFMKVQRVVSPALNEKTTVAAQRIFPMHKEIQREFKSVPHTEIPSVTRHYQQEKQTLGEEELKVLESRIVTRLEENIVRKTEKKQEHAVTHEAHVVKQREEKKMADKVYRMVSKRWDKELRRKGYLYE